MEIGCRIFPEQGKRLYKVCVKVMVVGGGGEGERTWETLGATELVLGQNRISPGTNKQ